jgi:hypothetical protein
VYDIEQFRHCELLYDYPLFGKLSMTSPELSLATKGAATLSPGIAVKALVYKVWANVDGRRRSCL